MSLKMMRKGLSMKNPTLCRIDEDEVASTAEVDIPPRSHFHRVHSWDPERRRPSETKKFAGCESSDINECAEAFIRRFRQQLHMQQQRRECMDMKSYGKMLPRTASEKFL